MRNLTPNAPYALFVVYRVFYQSLPKKLNQRRTKVQLQLIRCSLKEIVSGKFSPGDKK